MKTYLDILVLVGLRYFSARMAEAEAELEARLKVAGVCDYCFRPKAECSAERNARAVSH